MLGTLLPQTQNRLVKGVFSETLIKILTQQKPYLIGGTASLADNVFVFHFGIQNLMLLLSVLLFMSLRLIHSAVFTTFDWTHIGVVFFCGILASCHLVVLRRCAHRVI